MSNSRHQHTNAIHHKIKTWGGAIHKQGFTYPLYSTPIKKSPRIRRGFKRGCTNISNKEPWAKRRRKDHGKESIHKKIKTIYNPAIREHHTQPKGISIFLSHLVTASAADYTPDVLSDNTPFTPLDPLTPAQTLSAQHKTSKWLESFAEEDEEILSEAQQQKVANTFNALTQNDPRAKERLLNLDLPEEIKSAVGMVTAYQWKFVEQAEELRSMAVSHIVKEVHHPDARIRLKALEMLGKVTEVALFTDRIAVKNEDVTDEELDARIKEKLGKYMGVVDVVDVEEIEVSVKSTKDLAQEKQNLTKENE